MRLTAVFCQARNRFLLLRAEERRLCIKISALRPNFANLPLFRPSSTYRVRINRDGVIHCISRTAGSFSPYGENFANCCERVLPLRVVKPPTSSKFSLFEVCLNFEYKKCSAAAEHFFVFDILSQGESGRVSIQTYLSHFIIKHLLREHKADLPSFNSRTEIFAKFIR